MCSGRVLVCPRMWPDTTLTAPDSPIARALHRITPYSSAHRMFGRKTSATHTPSGVKLTLTGSQRPIQPFSAYSADSAMPATAVGSANGRSTRASTRRLAGKR